MTRQRAHFDSAAFAADVQAALGGVSYRKYHCLVPWITVNTLSRAVNRRPLSVANFLALCSAMRLTPSDYFSVEIQSVPSPVSRETRGAEIDISSILDRIREART